MKPAGYVVTNITTNESVFYTEMPGPVFNSLVTEVYTQEGLDRLIDEAVESAVDAFESDDSSAYADGFDDGWTTGYAEANREHDNA